MLGSHQKRLVCVLVVSTLLIQGCTQYIYTKSQFPAAVAKDPRLLTSAPNINLERYQSVQNEQNRPWQRGDIAIAVAASGGGYRAANVTAGFMLGMQSFHDPKLNGSLLDEVDYFSTVSGSGFAVGAYISSLHDYLVKHPNVKSLSEYDYSQVISSEPESLVGIPTPGPLATPFTRSTVLGVYVREGH